MHELSQVPSEDTTTPDLWGSVVGTAAGLWKYKWLVLGTAAMLTVF